MVKKKINKNYLWILGVAVIIAVLGLYQIQQKQIPATNTTTTINSNEIKTYTSKLLRISIDLPVNFQVEEKFTNLILNNKTGKIILSRAGTNFNNLDDYLQNLSELNHFNINNKENIIIDKQSAVKGEIDGNRYYFIYFNNLVFSIWTNVPTLFSDLDQIAQSFRYTP